MSKEVAYNLRRPRAQRKSSIIRDPPLQYTLCHPFTITPSVKHILLPEAREAVR